MNSAKFFDQSTALPPTEPAHLQVKHTGGKLSLGHLIYVLSPQITHEEKAKWTPKNKPVPPLKLFYLILTLWIKSSLCKAYKQHTVRRMGVTFWSVLQLIRIRFIIVNHHWVPCIYIHTVCISADMYAYTPYTHKNNIYEAYHITSAHIHNVLSLHLCIRKPLCTHELLTQPVGRGTNVYISATATDLTVKQRSRQTKGCYSHYILLPPCFFELQL